jgi:uncharacterized protein YaiE (UPF0345 family)
MSTFDNVSVVKKANVYFEGKVSSRTVVFADGSKKTLGFMLPGEYTFNTADAEIMEIMAGELEVLLPGTQTWQTIKGGESFDVPANAKFTVNVKTATDYCCSFIK